MMTTKTLQVGDRVRYASDFLRHFDICTGWLPQARGTIEAITTHDLVTVKWDDPCPEGYYGGARACNLEHA